jgi:hypothetical protein
MLRTFWLLVSQNSEPEYAMCWWRHAASTDNKQATKKGSSITRSCCHRSLGALWSMKSVLEKHICVLLSALIATLNTPPHSRVHLSLSYHRGSRAKSLPLPGIERVPREQGCATFATAPLPLCDTMLRIVSDMQEYKRVSQCSSVVDPGLWSHISRQYLSCAVVRGRGIVFRNYRSDGKSAGKYCRDGAVVPFE